ncbi:MAG: glycoside hydrolase family 88 protein, partial [Anaeroplasmataceae bacterium]|nr:glycoside hydrolase family 88 protein [Anaeroplasmataceae bacterium]
AACFFGYKRQVFDNLTSYIDSLMERTIDYVPAWNQEGFKGRWNYIDGVFLNSIVNLYTGTNDKRYKEFFLNYINGYINADGEFVNLQKKEQSGYTSGELDTVCESRILFDAFDMTSDNRYLTALDYTYQELGKMPLASGTQNYSHKVSYPNQIWLDGMYMYVPFLARYALLKDKPEIFDTIKTQYEYIRNHMFDEEKKLYYHGHDTTKSVFWADKETGNSKSFWLRSNGWLIVSLVDVLEYYPAGENKEYLKGLLKEALEGILQYQDEDSKLFFQLVDLGKTAVIVPYEYLKSLKNTSYTKDSVIKNYLESSGSSMIAYSLMKAARLGYISSEYQQIGNDIFEGIYGYSYKNGSLENICITAGLGPENNAYRDGTAEYYLAEPVGKDDAKGVGPFLMAFLEYAMKHNKI